MGYTAEDEEYDRNCEHFLDACHLAGYEAAATPGADKAQAIEAAADTHGVWLSATLYDQAEANYEQGTRDAHAEGNAA